MTVTAGKQSESKAARDPRRPLPELPAPARAERLRKRRKNPELARADAAAARARRQARADADLARQAAAEAAQRLGLTPERLRRYCPRLTAARLALACQGAARGSRLAIVRVLAVTYTLAANAEASTGPLPTADLAALANVSKHLARTLTARLAALGLLTREGSPHGVAAWRIPAAHDADAAEPRRYCQDLTLSEALALAAHAAAGSMAIVIGVHAAGSRRTVTPIAARRESTPSLAATYGIDGSTCRKYLSAAVALGLLTKHRRGWHRTPPGVSAWQRLPAEYRTRQAPTPLPFAHAAEPAAYAAEPAAYAAEPALAQAARARQCARCHARTDLRHPYCRGCWPMLTAAERDQAAALSDSLALADRLHAAGDHYAAAEALALFDDLAGENLTPSAPTYVSREAAARRRRHCQTTPPEDSPVLALLTGDVDDRAPATGIASPEQAAEAAEALAAAGTAGDPAARHSAKYSAQAAAWRDHRYASPAESAERRESRERAAQAARQRLADAEATGNARAARAARASLAMLAPPP